MILHPDRRNPAPIGLVMAVVLVFAAQAIPQDSPATQAAPRDPEILQRFSVAEAHHDLAELYIKKGEFNNAVIEARKIIQLRFPPAYETLVAQSLSILTEKFAEAQRFDLGQMLLDEALKAVELDATRARLTMNKARLFKLAGDDNRAIEAYRRALEFEGRRIR
jgi:lipopolysaccharide biosynthesis regulator YciM